MKAIIGITLLCINIFMAYTVYNDRNVKKYKCKKIAIINFVFLWLGVITTTVACIITNYISLNDLLYTVVTSCFTIVMCWFLFLKDFYLNLNKLVKDTLPFLNEQTRIIRKTYIRNILFLCFYIIQIIVLINKYN